MLKSVNCLGVQRMRQLGLFAIFGMVQDWIKDSAWVVF